MKESECFPGKRVGKLTKKKVDKLNQRQHQ